MNPLKAIHVRWQDSLHRNIHCEPKKGKTYFGCTITVSAFSLKHKTRYIRYFDLLQNLIDAMSKGGLLEVLDYSSNMDCMVVDDWMKTPTKRKPTLIQTFTLFLW